ncbi:MAG: hypothetical protein K2X31_06785 [Sphingopyxis sp.]|nr:hypothetical protein [Sphingopyxis sp.]
MKKIISKAIMKRAIIALPILLGAAVPSMSAPAQEAPDAPAGLAMLCAGWKGAWRTEIDQSLKPDGSWGPGQTDRDWRVDQTAPGRCRFVFGGTPAFDVDTTKGFYDVTGLESGKPGPVRRGRVLHAELVNPKAWNVVVESPGRAGTSRLQMTMAGDLFVIYLTNAGPDAARLKPDGIAVHRRQ